MEKEKFADLKKQTSMKSGSGLKIDCVPFITEGGPLNNVVVLDNIVRYLRFQDIQSFRLVCHKWNKISERVFWKLSRIKVVNGFDELRGTHCDLKIFVTKIENEKLIRNFNSTFPSPEILWNAVAFQGCFTIETLDYFWKQRGASSLTDIYLRSFSYTSKDLKQYTYDYLCNYYYDLNPYIQMTPNITTLVVTHLTFEVRLMVSLNKLPNIQILNLENCKIILNGKIAPKELQFHFSNCVSYKGKEFRLGGYGGTERILINEFVDFSKIKKLSLYGDVFRLDVGRDAIDLESIDINGVEIVNTTISKWTTNRYDFMEHIAKQSFSGNKMPLKLIDIRSISLQTFPVFLEKLSIVFWGQLDAPEIIVCPNLKFLSFSTVRKIDYPIFDFKNCTALNRLDVRILNRYTMNFNMLALSNETNIKHIKLLNVDITTEVPWQLDTLILDKYSFSFAKSVFQKFSTVTRLVLNFDTALELDEEKTCVLDFWNNSSIDQIALGPITWSDSNPFPNSEFAKHVDNIGSHFLFTKTYSGKGKAIDSVRFTKLLSSINEYEKDFWDPKWDFMSCL